MKNTSNRLNIAVYCASSSKVDSAYIDAAQSLGDIFAEEKVHAIFGAGHSGLMGAFADAVIAKEGTITGVIPAFMIENNWHHSQLEQLIITDTMHERKARMAQLADAAVALPGGCGTLEELLEVITWKQLNLFCKPIIIVNIKDYFAPLLAMLEKAVSEQFMHPEHRKLWEVVSSPDAVLSAIRNTLNKKETDSNFAVV